MPITNRTRTIRRCTFTKVGPNTYQVNWWERGRSQVIGTVQKQGSKWVARTPFHDTLVQVAKTRTEATLWLAQPYVDYEAQRGV